MIISAAPARHKGDRRGPTSGTGRRIWAAQRRPIARSSADRFCVPRRRRPRSRRSRIRLGLGLGHALAGEAGRLAGKLMRLSVPDVEAHGWLRRWAALPAHSFLPDRPSAQPTGRRGRTCSEFGRNGTTRAVGEMRHMAHFCVAVWRKATLKRRQCDAVLAQNSGRIAMTTKKPARAGT
jgi:hypothetical protein